MPFDYQTVHYRSLGECSVVITGGASAIGEEMVKAFVAQGSRVTFIDIDAHQGTALVSATGASFHACDVTDIPALRDTLARIEHEHHGIDVLVHNAGKDDRHDIGEVEPDDWRRALALNLDHQFFATQAVSKGMASAGRGTVIMLGHFLDARTSWHGRLHDCKGGHQRHDPHARPRARPLRHSGELHRAGCDFDRAAGEALAEPELNQQFLDLQALKFRLDASHVAKLALLARMKVRAAPARISSSMPV